ncbi:TIGR03749 family integrating conjugative element protein [Acidovorax sp. SUPP3334]|uniref:TIGR03749 family integrating conjugative element protein n=1 Tax=Acidovorax sp. SUPP3334 TaxID=2920881 RepID=UPI0023DE5A87|nr:TIGR03749 family integrating conjugative element protein [Acidovorax sp. SUPP3334]GKT26692.1 TIGR03749 family integrating conjugative element protein [Acidovorax sp. SUPP3334]
MRHVRFSISLLLSAAYLTAPAQALEILRWERLPLAVPLHVDQERVVFIDRNIRVGVPASLEGRLRVQSAGGAIYLRASEPIEPTRLQLQDADTGALILLDVAADAAGVGQPALEPVRIVEADAATARYGGDAKSAGTVEDAVEEPGSSPRTPRETPIPVVLTRFAAQNLYAPLRTVEPLSGITRVNLPRHLALETLLPTVPVRARALSAWRLDGFWVTAVQLSNASQRTFSLDPRDLVGDFVTATFQHGTLGPAGQPDDTSVVYLVTKGHGLAQSLLPAIGRIDAAANLPKLGIRQDGASHEK